MHPCRQGEVDLCVKHQSFAFGCGESDCCGMRASAGSQRPALHEQLLISRNPHTPTRPSFAHCDCTAAGSTGLSLRSEEHTSELQSLMRISYAVFCLKKKTKHILE